MGCCAATKVSSLKLFRSERGINPKRLANSGDSSIYLEDDAVYLFGGNKVLQFDPKLRKVTVAPSQPQSKLPAKTQPLVLTELKKIVTVGGLLDGRIVRSCYLLSYPDLSKTFIMPDFPIPIVNTSLAYTEGVLYAVGGETDSQEDDGLTYRVFRLGLRDNHIDSEWTYFCDLPLHRRSANLVVFNRVIYVMGGGNLKTRSTQIDSVHTVTAVSKKEEYRLPMGVEGARMAWFDNNILFIGGKRNEDKPDNIVYQMNFRKKGILSSRDLVYARDCPLLFPLKNQEILVLGGTNNRNAEIRQWDQEQEDYVFKPCTVEVTTLLDPSAHYETAKPTFVVAGAEEDQFPALSTKSKFMFGNEVDNYFVEFPDTLIPSFFWSSMTLQQKSGQSAYRFDPNTIYFVGGTDMTRTKLSYKSYKFDLTTKKTLEIAKLSEARHSIGLAKLGNYLYAIGGKRLDSQQASSTVERVSQITEMVKWEQVPPLISGGRFGHSIWTSTNGKKIFVMGGLNKEGTNPDDTLEVYDSLTNTWTKNSSLA